MSGHIRRRGKKSWELKFDLGTDPVTGSRKTRYHSVKGTKREAESKLTELMAAASKGFYVDPSRLTVWDFLDRWERDWAKDNISPKSAERYHQLLDAHVRPEIGAIRIQKLLPGHLAELYAKLLRDGRRRPTESQTGLATATVRYVHRVLHRAFGHAVQWGVLPSNPCEAVDCPKAAAPEIEILTETQVADVLSKLRGRSMYVLASVGLATGMRRGELLALRWQDLDLDAGRIQIERSLEQTTPQAGTADPLARRGLRFKLPKTKRGRRQITLPASIVTELRAHKKRQAEQRLAAGLGRDADGSLVFRQPDGEPLLPNSISTEWRRLVADLGLPKVSLHAWRHTHASQLIASGMDILTISRRLGHAKPSITLDIYGHLFSASDDKAAAVFERAYANVLSQ